MSKPDFDEVIDRTGTNSAKWDLMERAFGVSPEDGIAMWVADMDFRAPGFITAAAQAELAKENYGYFCGLESYVEAIRWWQDTRHGWNVEPEWIFTTGGLGHAIGYVLQAFSEPGDHVAIFSPVYHEFAHKIRGGKRAVTELPLVIEDGVYKMDFASYDARMTGREKILLISAPHNPAGRVWTRDEMQAIATFCEKHDLLLVSDEIHADLVLPGHKHLPAAIAAPEILPRLIALTSASKTFNLAGLRTGNVIIPDPDVRAKFKSFFDMFNFAPNLFGVSMTRAAYSPEGAEWVDALTGYLAGNAALFQQGVDAIPGVRFMPMQSTYLSWVDFAGTGMTRAEFSDRIYKTARIAATPGHTLGTGGESFMRFNIGTRRSQVAEAVERLQAAFADLQ